MTDRPILFSAPMVRALLDGRKTQTRRILKPQPQGHVWRYGWSSEDGATFSAGDELISGRIPIWAGYRLWVKETWRTESRAYDDLAPSEMGGEETILYDADADWNDNKTTGKTRVSIHMPRWASRTTLIVTDVRVERLHDISEKDAEAEGAYRGNASGRYADNYVAMAIAGEWFASARGWYRDLWDRINGFGAWEANPWVAAYTFTVIKQNIDQIEKAAA